MKIFGKNLKKDILYIAEIGVNHEGNLKRCFKLIKDAKIAGADVVKFQCFNPTKYISINEKKFKKISKFYFDKSQFNKIIKFCKKLKINYLFTPVSHDWLNFIRKNSKTVKIASGDLNFHYLLKKATKFNLNIFLSTGISDLEEIKAAVRIIKDKYRKKIKQKLVLMHCVSSYPVPDAFANTMSVKFLKDKFSDAFRLEKTYCCQLKDDQILYLFPSSEKNIFSTALCPVIRNGEILAMLALGSKTTDHFNVHLDSLFLDFICQTLGIIISRTLMVSDSRDPT